MPMPPVPSTSRMTKRPTAPPRSMTGCESRGRWRSAIVSVRGSLLAIVSASPTPLIPQSVSHHQAAVDVDRAPIEVVALERELHGEPDVFGDTNPADGDHRDEAV